MKKILIAEDDFYIRDIYARVFTASNFDTHLAVDGQEALDKIHKEGPFDIVLLDILMPKMTGIEVLKQIRAMNTPDKAVPVYIISNLGQDNIIEDTFKMGLNGYVIKSQVTPQQLVDEVNQYFARQESKATPQN